MPYTLYKTNGLKLTTVDDGTLNLTTDLSLVGRNYAGYGQVVNDNLVKLLENFANNSAPSKPLAGQLWYDTSAKKLKLYDGIQFKTLLTTTVSTTQPSDLNNGDLWFDAAGQKLYIKNLNELILIGPGGGSGTSGSSGGSTTGGAATSNVLSSTNVPYDIIKLSIGEATIGVISPNAFNVDITDPLYTEFSQIKYGITLKGADPITGVSTSTQSYFWGTAADSVRLNGRPSTDYLLSSQVNFVAGNITQLLNLNKISTGSPSTPGTIEGAWSLIAGSTLQATFADLAERYESDSLYDFGTVLVVGGSKEVTITKNRADVKVAGIVSKNPAFKMNSSAGDDWTHPYIALKGRVPCKVTGKISKGDHLVSSERAGYAESFKAGDDARAIIGIALEDFEGVDGLIEVKV